MEIIKPFFLNVCLSLCLLAVAFTAISSGQATDLDKSGETNSQTAEKNKSDLEKKKSGNKIVVKQRTPSERLIPANARLWVSIPNPTELINDFNDTQFGEISGDQALQPFVEKAKAELKKMLDKNNIDLGIRPEDLMDVHSGEVCIAAVQSEDDPADFGFIMLADVEKTQVEANDLLKRLAKEFKAQKGKSEKKDFDGLEVTKWSFEPLGMKPRRFAFHAISEGWLFICDNETLARQVVKHISAKHQLTSLADNEVFKTVREKANFPNIKKTPQIKWYAEPFGYLDIVKRIADRHKALNRERGNDYAKIFKERGFDAIRGFGGNFVITKKHEFAYRSHVYAPANGTGKRRFKGAAELLDFKNVTGHNLEPEVFVSDTSSGYMTFTWNLQKAFNNVAPIMDASMGENAFKNLIDSIKNDADGPRVDLEELVKKLDNRLTVFTDNTLPINESSEKVVVGVKVKKDIKRVYEWVKRIINIPEENIVKFEGINLYVDKSEELEPFEEDFEDIEGEETGEEDAPKPPKPIFDQRIYAATNGYILMSNDLEYMKKIIRNIKKKPGTKLKNAGDYKAVYAFLAKMSDEKKVSYRQFIRLDQSIRVNYEMLRQGKMGSSNTVLAKILNQILTPPGSDDEAPRTQKIDGSDLPKDFQARIAPYFGPAGFVMESVKNGWTLSGVVLPKKNRANVASNKDETEQRN